MGNFIELVGSISRGEIDKYLKIIRRYKYKKID